MRLDQAVAARFAPPRRKARALIADGLVFVNDRPVRVASREVNDGDALQCREALPSVDVIALHDDWLAVNKPAGVPTQPVRGRETPSLEDALRREYRSI